MNPMNAPGGFLKWATFGDRFRVVSWGAPGTQDHRAILFTVGIGMRWNVIRPHKAVGKTGNAFYYKSVELAPMRGAWPHVLGQIADALSTTAFEITTSPITMKKISGAPLTHQAVSIRTRIGFDPGPDSAPRERLPLYSFVVS